MAARHGTISPTLRAGVLFWGGAEGGGGGWRLLCAPSHAGGGVAGGSSVRHGRENPVASPGLVGPFEEEPRIRRGGLRYMVWFLGGLHSTAGAALACGGACGACTAQLVRPWRAGVPVGPAQHSWCGPGVRGCLWGLHSTAGAALACGGACGACTTQLVRPWRAGGEGGGGRRSEGVGLGPPPAVGGP